MCSLNNNNEKSNFCKSVYNCLILLSDTSCSNFWIWTEKWIACWLKLNRSDWRSILWKLKFWNYFFFFLAFHLFWKAIFIPLHHLNFTWKKYCKRFLCDAAFWCQYCFILYCCFMCLLSMMSILPSIDDSRNVSTDIG